MKTADRSFAMRNADVELNHRGGQPVRRKFLLAPTASEEPAAVDDSLQRYQKGAADLGLGEIHIQMTVQHSRRPGLARVLPDFRRID